MLGPLLVSPDVCHPQKVSERAVACTKQVWKAAKGSGNARGSDNEASSRAEGEQTNRANQNKHQEAAPGASPGAHCQQTGWVLRASTAPTENGPSALEKGHQVMVWEIPVAGSVWGLGEHRGRSIYIHIHIHCPFSVVGRCELAVAVPVGTEHWQVTVCPAWGWKQLQENWEIPKLAAAVMVLGNAAGWIYGEVGGYLLPALLSPV